MKSKVSNGKVTIWIGKEGASKEMMHEISKQLDKKRMIKIQILKSALKNNNAKAIAVTTAQQTEATLIDVRGHTFILHKPRKKMKQTPK